MDHKSELLYPKWSSIPEVFYSDLTGKPFEQCVSCECELLKDGVYYFIEKAVKGFHNSTIEHTVFEYAICLNCAQNMKGQLSEESMKNIEAFYRTNVNFEERLKSLVDRDESAWLADCLINKKPVSENGECQLYGFCNGDSFHYNEFPYMLRAEALDEVVELISAETMDELDNFKNELDSGPPELKELFDKGGIKVLL